MLALVIVAAARRRAQLRRQRDFDLAEDRRRLGRLAVERAREEHRRPAGGRAAGVGAAVRCQRAQCAEQIARLVLLQDFVQIIGARDPFDAAARARQAQFLREGVRADAIVDVEQRERAGVAILAVHLVVPLIGRDRGQRDAAQIPAEPRRRAPILDLQLFTLVIFAVVEARRADIAEDIAALVRRDRVRRAGGRETGRGVEQAEAAILRRARVDLAAMDAQQRVESVGDVECELTTQREAALPVLAPSGQQIMDIAVRMGARSRDAEADAVRDRPADRRLAADRVERAIGERGLRLKIVAWLGGDEVDRAARRVAAIERALRPFQHLDAFEVEKLEGLRAGRTDIDLVDIDTVRSSIVRIGVGEPDAADIDERLIALAAGKADLKVRDDARDVRTRLDAKVGDGVAREGGDGDGDVLQILFAALRGDDDVADAFARGFGSGLILRHHRDGELRRYSGENGRRDSKFRPFFHIPGSLVCVIAFTIL